jgi:UDP-glucose 4-epimerase
MGNLSFRTKTLLIGGAGYIGAHLVPELLKRDRSVTVLGRKVVPEYPLPADAVYVSGDFMDGTLLASLLDSHDEVVHLANPSSPKISSAEPLADLLQNLPPAMKLFAECACRGVKLLLVSSGGGIYGEAFELPITEIHPTRPVSPYGVTKLTIESYARFYASSHGLKVICVRPANAYGIGQRPFIGQGFISTAMASAMRGMPITIFGTAGTVRDYVYVSDVAMGLASALMHGRIGETYNLGSGVGLSNKDILDAMSPLLGEMGYELHTQHLPERSTDVKTNVLDARQLMQDTGWVPCIPLAEGLRLTAGWLRKTHGLTL